MNDGVDQRVVDGGCFGDDGRHRFGIRSEDAAVPDRGRRYRAAR